MELKRSGTQPSQKGPSEFFIGTVRIDPLHTAPAPARVACASVTFEPGRPHRLAHASPGPDPHRDRGLRMDAMRGRSRGRDPRR